MPSIILNIGGNIRSLRKPIHNFSLLANVSSDYYSDVSSGYAQRSELARTVQTEWGYQYNNGINPFFINENKFRDQNLHDRMSRGFVMRGAGTLIKYYTSSFDVSGDPLYFEDNNRVIERVFDLKVITTFQPENEIYNRFNIQHLDESEMYVHMSMFLELNYQSLRRAAIKPLCPSSKHNPIWSQRGYSDFSYHGYTFDQIGPKAGDKFKMEANDTLYEIESVKDASPEHHHLSRKYFWKLFYKDVMDTSQTISEEVLNDPEQKDFINNLLGLTQEMTTTDENSEPMNQSIEKMPFAKNATIDKLKKDVLYRPPEVPKTATDISKHPYYTPGVDKLGHW
jgi:hypothetical protein